MEEQTFKRGKSTAMNRAYRVLVVDDEESIIFVLQRFLTDIGFHVGVAQNLLDAKALLSAYEFDVSIIDRILSDGENGLELINYINANQPFCQTILISAYPSFESAAETLKYKTFAYLAKPVRKKELFQLVEKAAQAGKAKKAEEAAYSVLKHHNALFHCLLDSSPQAIVIYDLSGRVTFINSSFTRFFGYEKEEVLGKCISYVPEWDQEKTESEIADLLNGKPVSDRETERWAKDGRIINVTIRSSLCRNRKGKPINMLVILQDITKAKIMENKLLQSSKMEALGELAGGIAHNFNNMLNVIVGHTEILLKGKSQHHPDHRALIRIKTLSQKCNSLTKQLLGLGVEQELSLKTSDLNAILTKLVELIRDFLPKTMEIEMRLAEDLRLVQVDSLQLEQCCLNLLINARDAILERDVRESEEGGGIKPTTKNRRVLIETKNLILDKADGRLLHWFRPGKYILLTISDTGIGMSENLKERIFDPFFTTKQGGKGSELGLAVVYRTIKNHQGSIDVFS